MIIVLWILGILAALVVLQYLILILKRLSLYSKIKKKAFSVKKVRNLLRSVFVPDGKTDLLVCADGTEYAVSVLTTPFRRVKYSFRENRLAVLKMGKSGVYMGNPRVPNPTATLDRPEKQIAEYKLSFPDGMDTSTAAPYVIPHPAPANLVRVKGSATEYLGNDDIVQGAVRICGLSHFLQILSGPAKQ